MTLFLFLALLQVTRPVGISWQANAEPDLAGYRVYWDVPGHALWSYANMLDVGNVTSYGLPLLVGSQVCVAMTAYNAGGVESGFSNEICGTVGPDFVLQPPVISRISP